MPPPRSVRHGRSSGPPRARAAPRPPPRPDPDHAGPRHAARRAGRRDRVPRCTRSSSATQLQVPMMATGFAICGLVFAAVAVLSVDGRRPGRPRGPRRPRRCSRRCSAGSSPSAALMFLAAAVIMGMIWSGTSRRDGRLVHSPGPAAGHGPPSSRGLGRHPFKVEIAGSNPAGGTTGPPVALLSSRRWRSWA